MKRARLLFLNFCQKAPRPGRQLLCACLFTVLQPVFLAAQTFNLGTPPIRNFSKKAYRGGTQTWDMAQDAAGRMFFANNDGLLEFDGARWRLYPLANHTIARSVFAAADGKIYVGGQGDFGFFEADGAGKLVFQSLRERLPEGSRNFSEVWDILEQEGGIFFRASDRVFLLRNQAVQSFLKGEALEFMGRLDGKVVVQDARFRLHVFDGNGFRPMENPLLPPGAIVTAILPYHADTQLVTTIKHGIFYFSKNTSGNWRTTADDPLKNARIYCAALLENGDLALATSLSGLLVMDRQRRIVRHFTKKNGLQNNTILSVFPDWAGSLWLGLDNGIDFLDIQSPLSNIFPDGDLQGTGYAVEIAGGNLYFGTNTGLFAIEKKPFYAPDEQLRFRLVTNSEGQVWGLNAIGDELLMGHHEGAFLVQGFSAKKLSGLAGTWKFLPLSATTLLAGHYNGAAFFTKTSNGWAAVAPAKGLTESSRILEKTADGSVWMAHPYKGVFRLRPDTLAQSVQAEFFDRKNGLPSDFNNYVFKLGESLVFAAEAGVFNFDEKGRRFLPDAHFDRIFGKNTRVNYLRQDANGNVWYVAGGEVGVLLVEDKGLEKQVRRLPIPELSGKMVGGFEFILPLDERNVFIATDQGFVHFDPVKYRSGDSTLRMVLHEARLETEDGGVLFGGHSGAANIAAPVLTHRQNALRFTFSATDFRSGEWVQYAHFLKGAERDWSEWSGDNELVFNNLSPGTYLLRLKARNKHGAESGELTFPFEIRPPWYASRFAIVCYVLVALASILAVLMRQRKRFERERQALQATHQEREAEHQQFALASKEAISRLLQEKLEAEVMHKNQELASATMHLVQKSEMQQSIKAALEKLEKKTEGDPGVKSEIRRIVKLLEQDASLDEDWAHFSKNFDQVHSDFLKRLAEQFPQLSPNDFKLCAYLRMNLSTKEIASLLNLSVRGVEASRYRLRKRLGLGTEVNLTEFLMRV